MKKIWEIEKIGHKVEIIASDEGAKYGPKISVVIDGKDSGKYCYLNDDNCAVCCFSHFTIGDLEPRGFGLTQEMYNEIKDYVIKNSLSYKEEQEFLNRKAEASKGIKWEVKRYYEDRETISYCHTFVINGKRIVLNERNIFDVGTVINPNYSVAPGYEKGGSVWGNEDGELFWDVWEKEPVKMTEEEIKAYELVRDFGEIHNFIRQ